MALDWTKPKHLLIDDAVILKRRGERSFHSDGWYEHRGGLSGSVAENVTFVRDLLTIFGTIASDCLQLF
ncbi:hypothetical protein AMC87_CH02908 [Rhizobium phaseoli]|nr:hypothetical protein AMC87_CH02908 [Rhizobium phaseoli]